MLVGTVIGKVWSTQKEQSLEGLRFLMIRPWLSDGSESAEPIVAVDPIGADVGEKVLVVFGRAARHAIGRGQDIGFQTAVVGVVDELDVAKPARRPKGSSGPPKERARE